MTIPGTDNMETSCEACGSRFRVTEAQLYQASGQVRCGTCEHIFDALPALTNFDSELVQTVHQQRLDTRSSPMDDEMLIPPGTAQTDGSPAIRAESGVVPREISLEEAMYGNRQRSSVLSSPLIWLIGILLLIALGFAQAIYYQRYKLIENPRFQKKVITLCEILPCTESQFSSTAQIQMLERNVFTHPVNKNALMVTGSFMNQAPFPQKLPGLLISLFDIQGKLIANRLFSSSEYLLENRNRRIMPPETPIQFRLEIIDPGTNALTYEFEFI